MPGPKIQQQATYLADVLKNNTKEKKDFKKNNELTLIFTEGTAWREPYYLSHRANVTAVILIDSYLKFSDF